MGCRCFYGCGFNLNYMGVSMEGILGLIAVLVFIFGVFCGSSLELNRYNDHISICAANNFTYQKCGELYGWKLK